MKAETQDRDSSPEICGSILVANPLPSSPPLHSPATPTTPGDHKTPPPPPRRRGTVACRRCRRLRTKCVHGPDCQAPCEACRASGHQAAAECSFPRRGEKDTDRDFRRRPPTQRMSVSSSSSSRGTPGLGGACASVAPAVQPLPAGASLPVDAPLPARLSASTAAARHHSSSLNGARLSGFPAHGSLGLDLGLGLGYGHGHGHGRRHHAPSAMPMPSSGAFFPPHEEIVAGCRVFVSSYFQLGFLPKAIFIEAISRSLNSVSPFLLSCILSISARFTPSLVRRYGGPARATENFLQIARALASAEMYKPSLERTQGFFLLAISEWGNGDKERSSMDMGVAVRMASILRLHREETYCLPPGAPAEQVIRAEAARRTFWMIHSQENLQAGYSSPAPFPPDDITARLPCDEHDFAFGVNPTPRSVLSGTVPSQLQPEAARSQHRCLFATMVQSHHLWGQVARRACRSDLKAGGGTEPWEPASEYQALTRELRRFEEEMPERHRWSLWNLRGWRDEQLHLAYLTIVMVLRVSNIVERRIYLDEILLSVNDPHGAVSPRTRGAPEGFWAAMSGELFANVLELAEQIGAFAAARSRDEGFPAILVFCVYICGSLASYLWRYPQLCPRAAGRAEEVSLRCVRVLDDLHRAWPTSTRWNQGLQQIASPFSGGGSHGGSHGGSSSGESPPTSCGTSVDSGRSAAIPKGGRRRGFRTGLDASSEAMAACEESAIDPRLTDCLQQDKSQGHEGPQNVGALWREGEEGQPAHADADAFSNELFEAEMSTLLAGDADFGWLDFDR